MAIRNDKALFVECKWRNSEIDLDVYNELKRKSEMFNYQDKYLYIFSKNMFSAQLLSLANECNLVKLYSLNDMITLS
jgi:hypothetical protein